MTATEVPKSEDAPPQSIPMQFHYCCKRSDRAARIIDDLMVIFQMARAVIGFGFAWVLLYLLGYEQNPLIAGVNAFGLFTLMACFQLQFITGYHRRDVWDVIECTHRCDDAKFPVM